MTSLPDVSVVVPTRSRPALAVRAVQSALAQTHAAVEVLAVVDGPDAETEAALAQIADPRLCVIVLPERGRAPNARNIGVLAARGHWTAFLDDDDEWLPGKIAAQLQLASTARAAAPILASRLISRTPRADTVMPRRLPAPGEPVSEYFTVRRGLFYGDGFIQTSTIMAPTDLVRRVPFTVGLRRQQELDWTLRALRHPGTELLYAPDPLVIWHQDEDRDRISIEMPWQEQWQWLHDSRDMFTRRAYAAFSMSVLSSMAAPTRDRRVFWRLLDDARQHGRPAPIDYLTFLQIWALPPTLRRRLRDLIVGRRAHRSAGTSAQPTADPVSTAVTDAP
jgi:glycosyltransferase involved in cell wall biosynthesis